MSKVLSKNAEFELDSDDLSDYISNVQFVESADSEDVTTYGNDSHVKGGTLEDGSISVDGWYDNTASTGPVAVIRPLIGTVVTFAWRPEGTGSGKPETTGSVLVQSYTETAPVAGHITWAISLERSGTWTTAAQGA